MKRLLLLLLPLLLLLGGCTLFTGPEPTPAPTETPEPTPTPKSAAQLKREARLEEALDGFIWMRGYLYAVDSEGDTRKDTEIGVLHFGKNGHYTSGSDVLDKLVAQVLAPIVKENKTRFDMLRAAYEYTRDNIRYVGFGNHDLSYKAAHGEDGWMLELASYALANQKGDCYHFAAEFGALARGLGYQAFVVSGVIGAMDQEHGWVEIVDEDGTIYFCDPETEYSYMYWQQKSIDLFWKTEEMIGYDTGLSYRWFLDPFEAERGPAEKAEDKEKAA